MTRRLSRRPLAYLVIWLLCLALAILMWQPVKDWQIAATAGHEVLSGNWRVYVAMPEAQMGPLALVLSGLLPRWAFVAALSALLPLFVQWTVAPYVRDRRTVILAVVMVPLLAYLWALMAITGHADEALVLTGAAGILAGIRTDRQVLMCIAFAVAISGKPTAVLLVPLLLLRSWRLAFVGLAIGGLFWLPFFTADPAGFLQAGRGVTTVWPGAVPDMLGSTVGDSYPTWVRPVQLVGGMGLCWFVGRNGWPAAAVVAAFAFRALLEPAQLPGYSAAVIVMSVGLDLARRSPVHTGLALVSWAVAHAYHYGYAVATVRTPALIAVCVTAVAVGLSGDTQHRERPGDGEDNKSFMMRRSRAVSDAGPR